MLLCSDLIVKYIPLDTKSLIKIFVEKEYPQIVHLLRTCVLGNVIYHH